MSTRLLYPISLLENGEFELAKRKLEEIRDAYPESFEAHYYLGIACSKLGEYRMAIAAFDVAIIMNSNDVDTFIARGDAHYSLEHYLEAEADYSMVINALDPNNTYAYYRRGNTYVMWKRQGDLDLAIIDYEKAISIDGSYYDAYIGMIDAYTEMGDLDAAQDVRQKVEAMF